MQFYLKVGSAELAIAGKVAKFSLNGNAVFERAGKLFLLSNGANQCH